MSEELLAYASEPFASYTKTIVAKVSVLVFNRITKQPETIILFGDPKNQNDSNIIDVYSMEEDNYFRRTNRRLFETGVLIKTQRKEYEPSEAEKLNAISDEEITRLLKSKFYSLQSVVNKITSVAPLYRFLQIAKELDKSAKILTFIEGKISELQMNEYEVNEE